MLQNPPTKGGDLAARQRQHRRQNSTPTAWEAVNIAPLPNFSNQRPARPSHRRGLSLDQRPRLLPQTRLAPTMRESFAMVDNSATTNTDSAPVQQHIQREAQQHRFVNPGPSQQQQQQQQQQQLHNFLSQQQHQQHQQQQQQQQPHRQNRHQRHESDSFLLTPHGTPGNQHFEDFLDSAQGHMGSNMMHPAYYMESMDAMMKKNQANFATNNSLADPLGFNFFPADNTISPTNMNFVFPKADPAGSGAAWMSEPEMMGSESRPVSRRISNGILNKMAKFEPLLPDQTQRMMTPPAQNNPDGHPQTPLETATIKHPSTAPHARLNRFSDDYDESLEETIKPVRTTRPNGIAGLFPGMDQQTDALAQPQPQRSNTTPMGFPNSLSSPGFMNMAHVKNEFGQIDTGYDTLGHLPSDLSSPSSPSPMHGHMLAFGDSDSQNTIVPGRRSSPPNGASHQRTKSVASVVSATSFESINIEETRTDTGVTMDDIETHMKGPDPTDGQWVCTFEKCNKRFGRKENIKSHVQTHLNDRQYKCPVCGNCFVRQHDLKRHAKIHSGFKPYPCDCGKSFARQDALTRHRQRGMCVGALDGIVRKVVKRGRPRKNRPDMEERLEKSEKTRRKNRHAPSSSVSSSFSAFSESSSTVNSPGGDHDFDELMGDGNDGLLDIAIANHLPCTAATLDANGLVPISSAPMTGPRSPAVLSGIASRVASPDPISNYASPVDLVADYTLPTASAHLVPCPSSPAKSIASYYTRVGSTPPGLSASSSPPPPQRQSVRLFDHWDPNISSSAFDASSDTIAAPSSSNPVSSNTPLLESDHDGLPGMDDSGMSLLQFPADDDGPMPFDLVGTEMYHLQIEGVVGSGSGGGMVKLDEYVKEEGEAIVLPGGKDVFFGSF